MKTRKTKLIKDLKRATLLIMGILALSFAQSCGGSNSLSPNASLPVRSAPNGLEGGVSVGNGGSALTFFSAHGFSFEYNSRLSVIQKNDRWISVDDSSLSKARASSIDFMVLQSGADAEKPVKSVDELKEWLHKKQPQLNLQATALGEAEGFVGLEESVEQSRKDYFMLAPNLTLLHIVLSAAAADPGAELINQIPQTLNYDTKPPVVHQIEMVSEGLITAGNDFIIRLKAEEPGNSGISERIVTRWEVPWIPAIREIDMNMRLLKTEDGWMYFSGKTNPYTSSAVFQLKTLTLQDRMGNQSTWHLVSPHEPKPPMKSETESSETLPVRIHELRDVVQLDLVQPERADLEFPKLEKLRVRPRDLKNGDTEVFIECELSDDVSGIDPRTLGASVVPLDRGGDYAEEVSGWSHKPVEIKRLDDEGLRLKVRFIITIPSQAPTGRYSFGELRFIDRSGKQSTYGLSFNVFGDIKNLDRQNLQHQTHIVVGDLGSANIRFDEIEPYQVPSEFYVDAFKHECVGNPDLDRPIIRSFVADQLEVKPGDKVRFKMKIEETGSGVDPEIVFVGLTRPDSFFALMDDNDNPRRADFIRLVEAPNVYEGSFDIPLDVQEGLYLVGMISVRDRVGNEFSLFADADEIASPFDGIMSDLVGSSKQAPRVWTEDINHPVMKRLFYASESQGEEDKKTHIPVIKINVKK